ncbi:hypothetical protein P4O66_005330, partial [Electrophorus voltai]
MMEEETLQAVCKEAEVGEASWAENFTWTLNTSSITKRAQQCLYFLQKLRKAHLPSPILTTFYR